jgi:hypothetical protein
MGKGQVSRLAKGQVRRLPVDLESRVRSLSTEQIDFLGEALLDFEGMSDLLKFNAFLRHKLLVNMSIKIQSRRSIEKK